MFYKHSFGLDNMRDGNSGYIWIIFGYTGVIHWVIPISACFSFIMPDHLRMCKIANSFIWIFKLKPFQKCLVTHNMWMTNEAFTCVSWQNPVSVSCRYWINWRFHLYKLLNIIWYWLTWLLSKIINKSINQIYTGHT